MKILNIPIHCLMSWDNHESLLSSLWFFFFYFSCLNKDTKIFNDTPLLCYFVSFNNIWSFNCARLRILRALAFLSLEYPGLQPFLWLPPCSPCLCHRSFPPFVSNLPRAYVLYFLFRTTFLTRVVFSLECSHGSLIRKSRVYTLVDYK